MSNYKNILVAIDINADYDSIIQKALSVCQSPEDLNLVYISLSSVYMQPYLYGMDYKAIDDTSRMQSAREKLEEIGNQFGITKQQVFLKMGDPADEIKEVANDTCADLIVLGTHGRSGFKLLLGSTANAVLHGVKQDVLAVRIYDHK
ncbi:MAG: universal stress protein A [Glaciecola sp.]|jgi:universal stress protein A